MADSIIPLASLYQTTYTLAFKKLSKAMQDRVLACKGDNAIKDPEVDDWITEVAAKAEAKFDGQALPVNQPVNPS